jgi:DNA invertase Pin-like site-specific DNA recombinase
MKAIAYVRWSSDDQAAGNSLERQTANVEAYCARNNLELVETLIDDGLSAFKGHHISRGKFGEFLQAADRGKYRKHALIVEQMDRLSRQGISETGDLLKRIVKAGIEVHITQTNRVIRSLDDITTALLNVLESWSAEEYSRKLRERVGAAWRDKKRNSPAGVSITNKLPGWLDGKTGEPIRLNEARAAVVRRIFKMTAEGVGKRLIARRLNDEGVPTFGAGYKKVDHWGHSYIQRILENRAVLGEYQPHKNRKPDGDVRIDFYPAAITPELWQRAHTAMAARRSNTDAGDVTGKYAGRTGKMQNLFTGMVWDYTERNSAKPMHYKTRPRQRPRLESERTNGNDRANAFSYERFERWFLTWLDQLDLTSILDVAESEDLRRAEETVANLALDIKRGEQQVQKITDLLIDTPSKALKDRLMATEAQIEKSKSDKDAAEKRLDALKRRHHDLLDKSVIYMKLAESRDFETRARLREEIRRKVERIGFAFHQPGMQRNDTVLVVVRFVNGAVRVLIFFVNDVVTTGLLDDPSTWTAVRGDKEMRYTPEFKAAVKQHVIELAKQGVIKL